MRGRPTRVLGDQIRSVDKARLRGRISRLRDDELRDVDDAIRVTLGLWPDTLVAAQALSMGLAHRARHCEDEAWGVQCAYEGAP